jgi:hypothetical protein
MSDARPRGTYSGITDLTGRLERIHAKQRRKLVAVLYTDKHAAEVEACLQDLKWLLDSFLVCVTRTSMIKLYN